MKILKTGLLAFCALFSILGLAEAKPYTIKIISGDVFPEGSRVSLYRYNPVGSTETVEYFAEKTPLKKGEFAVSGEVTEPHVVHIQVTPPDNDYPYQRTAFALEPGETVFHFSGKKDFSLSGGKYSQLMVSSWNGDPDYKKALKALLAFDMDAEDPSSVEQYRQLSRTAGELKAQRMKEAFESTDDPMAKLMLYVAGFTRSNYEQAVQEMIALCHELEGTREATVSLGKVMQGVEARKARAAIDEGAVIKDFVAEDLSGTEFHLADVLKQNKYVLVEFWASWCGPCRAEIPHMKTAYKHFNKKGFEIVSFTLDHDRADWEEASEEEQFPWIDTGDLLADASPVKKMYGVNAIPANYLVEGATGKIVAKDLRGKALDDKLEELLGNK